MIIELIKLISIGIGRSLVGWYTQSMADGKISTLEWKKLVETMSRITLIQLVAYFGLNLFGVDVNTLGVAIGSFLFDLVFQPIYKKLKVIITDLF